jgi:predicted HTH domain antitoxin
MPLTIDDELLRRMGVTEEDVRIELFARLFDRGKLSFGKAAELARVSQDRMLDELSKRSIPRHRYSEEMLQQDMHALEHLRELDRAKLRSEPGSAA